ncbi:MAG: hypothetical protein R3A48_10840 [Polyangiales bacterium]
MKGIPGAESAADMLTDMGVDAISVDHEPLLRSPRRSRCSRRSLGTLRRGSENIRVAADRAAKIVFALRELPPTRRRGIPPPGRSANLDAVLTLCHNQ